MPKKIKSKPGWRQSIALPTRYHYWDGKTFSENSRPVAECHAVFELFPKVNKNYKPTTRTRLTCKECYERHSKW